MDLLNQPSESVFGPSLPESDGETRIGQSPGAGPSHDNVPPARIPRRRAQKACVACHKRKVRCDVLVRGDTCTNCRLDGLTCSIRPSRKRMRGKSSSPDHENVPATSPTETQPSHLIPCSTDASSTVHPLAVESFEKSPEVTTTPWPYSEPFTFSQPYHNPISQAQPSQPTDMMYTYFDFLEAESWAHIAPEDFKFLEHKGCLHLPSRPVLDALVREYFLHVHPVLPIINEREFWQIYFQGGRRAGHGKTPLFVFRAMLFVSCSFASDDTIRQLGFQSALEARSCMYRRAKLLYDFNAASDPIALSQGALILTYYSSDREMLANSSWLRLAIQYATSVNVQVYDRDPSISAEERLIRKRLWWCLVLRDRILALGVRRPIEITRDKFDFSQPKLSAMDLQPEFGNSLVYDKNTKSDLATIFLAQLDLAVELTDPLSYIYPADGFRSFDKLGPKDMLPMRLKIKRCKDDLDSWNAKFRGSISPDTWSQKHKSIALYSGLTSIYYQSARAALCQYESFSIQADDSAVYEPRMKELQGALHSSVASISDTIREFVQIGVAKYLPVSAVAYLALPIILSSLDLPTLAPINARTDAKRHQLQLLNEAMDLCGERYTGTVAANSMIKRTIEAARSENDGFTRVQKTTKPTSLVHSNTDTKDWLDVFVSNPAQYLRVSFTIDISLCTGHYPDTEDYLPQRLALDNRLLPSQSTSQALVPSFENILGNPGFPDEFVMSESTRGGPLDSLQAWSGTEDTLCDGQTMNEMLDELLGGGRF